jgi:phosphate starvation-inducible PhoH-like protein
MQSRPSESSSTTLEALLEPVDNERLANLCGQFDGHLRQIEDRLEVQIHNRGNHFQISGAPDNTMAARDVINELYSATRSEQLTPEAVHLRLQSAGVQALKEGRSAQGDIAIRVRGHVVRGRGPNQQRYLRNIFADDLSFGIGPAGTGKTYLAVCCAVQALERSDVERVLLVRPAVEAGERLGFLPGDLTQKVDPYLRPLYDALYELMGPERVERFIEHNVIEVAPLAYMRGRTLNEAFIILDEAQNTTVEQMKMFLTRIGFGSTAVVTGDVTQIDLPRGTRSGLKHAEKVLQNVQGISFTYFDSTDVVRHPLVQRIIRAYDAFEASERQGGSS